METLVENIRVGETVFKDDMELEIVDTYSVNGEGIGFVAIDENGEEIKFSKSCGTYLTVIEKKGQKSEDIIYCRTEEFAKQMFEFYINKGFSVMQSTVEIETGTHGKHVVKRLDILSKL